MSSHCGVVLLPADLAGALGNGDGVLVPGDGVLLPDDSFSGESLTQGDLTAKSVTADDQALNSGTRSVSSLLSFLSPICVSSSVNPDFPSSHRDKPTASPTEVTPNKFKGRGLTKPDDVGSPESDSAHPTEESFELGFAGLKRKKQRSVLVNDSKLLHDYSVKLVNCSLCRRSISSSQLRQHMETVHEISISYDCDVCHESGFKSKLALRVHLLNLHRLHCCICRKKLPSNEALLAHRKKHNDEPFDCRECGKSFSSESVLVQHFFIQHPLTAFSCRDCVHFFHSAFEKRTHDRIVHQRHPFLCPTCKTKFLVKRSYLLHLKAAKCKAMPKECPHCRLVLADQSLFRIHKAGCRFKRSYSKERRSTGQAIAHESVEEGDSDPRGRGGHEVRSDPNARPGIASRLSSSNLSFLEEKSRTQSSADVFVEKNRIEIQSLRQIKISVVPEISSPSRAKCLAPSSLTASFHNALSFDHQPSTLQYSNDVEVNVPEIILPNKAESVEPFDAPWQTSPYENIPQERCIHETESGRGFPDQEADGSLDVGEVLGEIFKSSALSPRSSVSPHVFPPDISSVQVENTQRRSVDRGTKLGAPAD